MEKNPRRHNLKVAVLLQVKLVFRLNPGLSLRFYVAITLKLSPIAFCSVDKSNITTIDIFTQH